MKHICLVFYLFVNILTSQNLLLVKKDGLLKILNVDDSNYKVVLDTLYHNKLVGYDWEGNTLVIFTQNQGRIKSLKYEIESNIYNSLYERNEGFGVNNFKALYFHSPNKSKTIYEKNHVKIVIDNGMRITCYLNNDEKWSRVISKKVFGGIGGSGFGYQNPILSSDFKKIVVSYIEPKFLSKGNPTILEIDLESGKVMNTINNASDFAYSGDSNFLLYFDFNYKTNVIKSLKDNKVVETNYFENSFWLLK